MDEPVSEFAEMFDWSGDAGTEPAAGMIKDMNREELLAEIDACKAGFLLGAEAIEELESERARRLVRELEEGIEDGSYGLLAELVMPANGNILETRIRAHEQLLRYDGILREIAAGADPGSFGNAALLYREAFPRLERIEPPEQELIDMIRDIVTVTGSCDTIPEQMMRDLRAHLESSTGVIELPEGSETATMRAEGG